MFLLTDKSTRISRQSIGSDKQHMNKLTECHYWLLILVLWLVNKKQLNISIFLPDFYKIGIFFIPSNLHDTKKKQPWNNIDVFLNNILYIYCYCVQ